MGYIHENYLTASKDSITFSAVSADAAKVVYEVTTAGKLYLTPSYFSEPTIPENTKEEVPLAQGARVKLAMINKTSDWVMIYYNGVAGYYPSAWLDLDKPINESNGVQLPTIQIN